MLFTCLGQYPGLLGKAKEKGLLELSHVGNLERKMSISAINTLITDTSYCTTRSMSDRDKWINRETD